MIPPPRTRVLIVELVPDVLTLDIEMPRMDGLTFVVPKPEWSMSDPDVERLLTIGASTGDPPAIEDGMASIMRGGRRAVQLERRESSVCEAR